MFEFQGHFRGDSVMQKNYSGKGPNCKVVQFIKHFMSDASSIAGSTDIDESSGVTEDESYDDYVGANPEENDEEDCDLGDDNDGDDGDTDENNERSIDARVGNRNGKSFNKSENDRKNESKILIIRYVK